MQRAVIAVAVTQQWRQDETISLKQRCPILLNFKRDNVYYAQCPQYFQSQSLTENRKRQTQF